MAKTKKASVLNSLESVCILLDRITDEKSFEETMPFIRFVLDSSVRRKLANHPFREDLYALIDGAIAYSDDVNAFSFALDELFTAVECL